MKNMTDYTTDAQQHKNELQEQVQEGQKIVQEIEKIKQGASDMPDGLDSDIAASIQGAVESARSEARGEMGEVSTKQEATKNAIGETQSEIGEKVAANDTAKGKLEGIGGSYGDSQIKSAVSQIEASTQRGKEISDGLQQAADAAANELRDLQGQI